MFEPKIRITDFSYILPPEKIPAYPLEKRDSSKLLIYNKGIIGENIFSSLPDYLPHNSLMVFNNTKVVPARLLFRKESGAFIEIFCLEPHIPADYNISFACEESCVWKTIIGNVKRWKGGLLSFYVPDEGHNESKIIDLKAELIEKEDNTYYVRFSWKTNIPFSKVLEICGKVPIPPYLNRETEAIDKDRYQTMYAKYRGSVAAPTAGLHFTNEVLDKIKSEGIDCEELCLHVGAGTFLPVKSEFVSEHIMHSEPFSVSKVFLEKLCSIKNDEKVIAVGTTSIRSLESLYYLGLQCIEETPEKWIPKPLSQWKPYSCKEDYSLKESIQALIDYMSINSLITLNLRTQIIIVPSYRFKVVDMLITNFHQPQSTLLLLIAAFVGVDRWREIYNYALHNNFRFLSYGDSSLLIR